MPNTQYYALVTTDHAGQATVEFRTSVNTGLRSYSVKVENPRSLDSDNLLVEIQIYSRRAPAPIEIFTPPETSLPTVQPTTTKTTSPETILPPVTTPEPVQTPLPAQVPTQKAPLGIITTVLAAGAGILLKRGH